MISRCPSCGAEVKDDESSCISCGWDFATNTLTQTLTLTAGIGEAYTPSVIGVDGTVYVIANAILFAIGQ